MPYHGQQSDTRKVLVGTPANLTKPDNDISTPTAAELAKNPELAAALKEQYFRWLFDPTAINPIAPDPEEDDHV